MVSVTASAVAASAWPPNRTYVRLCCSPLGALVLELVLTQDNDPRSAAMRLRCGSFPTVPYGSLSWLLGPPAVAPGRSPRAPRTGVPKLQTDAAGECARG